MKLPNSVLYLSICIFYTSGAYALNPPNNYLKKSAIEDWRFGGGIGYSLYITNQMDYSITTNYGNFNELIPSYFGAIYKRFNTNIEYGVQARHAGMLTLKSENTQGVQCNYNDIQFNVQYSLNGNIGLDKDKITFNAQIGLGAVNFQSSYFLVNSDTKSIDKVFSSVGYGSSMNHDIPDKKTVVVGNLGFNVGYRLLQNVSIYFENSFNISTSNKMSGNLFKRSWIPPDSYFFSSLGLYINFGNLGKGRRLTCPSL